MHPLIERVTGSLGLSPEIAEQAVAMVLKFVREQGPDGPAASLLGAIPGAEGLIGSAGEEAAESGGGGLMGGLMGAVSAFTGGSGGGALELGQKLMGLDLNMDQARGVADETLSYAREEAGDGVVDQVLEGIPGLKQLL